MIAGALEAVLVYRDGFKAELMAEIAKRDAAITKLEDLTRRLAAAEFLVGTIHSESEARRRAGLCVCCGTKRSPGSASHCRPCFQERARVARAIKAERAHNAHSVQNER